MAIITAPAEIAQLRKSGRIAARALQVVKKAVRPGVTTAELDAIAEKEIRTAGGIPSFKGFEGYPASLCTSINDEVVHGIPSGRALKEGDIIGLDIGVDLDGFFTDHAITVHVGKKKDHKAQRLLAATEKALDVAIAAARVGGHIGDIGAAQKFLEKQGLGIVTQLTGHGVGRAVHEPPTIFNVGQVGKGEAIVEGMVLAIEPMVTAGRPEVDTAADGWTVVTHDHSLAAHFEHTVLVTARGPEIITRHG